MTFVIFLYRISHYISYSNRVMYLIGLPILVLYKFITIFLYGFELHEKTKVGKNLKIYHRGHSTIINPCTVIGNNVEIRQNTTIGSTKISFLGNDNAPIIKDNVCIGANCCILGGITIGENSIIAAGSVVTKNVPPNSLFAGNPAVLIRMINL